MTPQQSKILNSFAAIVKPEQTTSIVEWAYKYVNLKRSARSEKADLSQTPWLIKPLETILGNNSKEIIILAPTGGGKSTMLEIAATYIVAERPGPTLILTQSDPDAYEWFQTGLKPALENCVLIKPFWPSKNNQIRKDFIQFPSMPLWVSGANLNNLQSKSCDVVIFDEAWIVKKGLIAEGRRRTHDRFNSKVVLASQAGMVGEDLDTSYDQTYKHEFSFKCRGCGNFHAYNFEDVKYECIKNESGIYKWESLSAWYECPGCGERYEDSVSDRRAMSDSAEYIPAHSENPVKGHIGFHFSALNVWWISWEVLVQEFLKAKDLAKNGNFNALRQFNQKRLAKPWSDLSQFDNVEAVTPSQYSVNDGHQLDITILTADVQKQDIWYTVRTWARDGSSKLLEANKVVDWRSLNLIQEKWKIKPKAVFIDSAYRTEEVKGVIAKNNWLGLNGRSESHYTITDKRGKKIKRLFSAPNRHKTANGEAVITYYSSNGAKDILGILKSGHGAKWEIPCDIGDEYLSQIDSEVKILGPNGHPMYKKVKSNNHMYDTEVMNLIAAMMWSVYPTVTVQED